MSVRELALNAGIDKSTVMRVEHGEPVSLKTLTSVCKALNTVLIELTAPLEEDSSVSHFRTSAENWSIVLNTPKSHSGLPNHTQVPDPQERKRLGGLGFVTGFIQSHECSIAGGVLRAAVIEVHEPFQIPATHAGEEFLTCLSGEVRVRVGEGEYILREGDSVTFRSELPHNFQQVKKDAAGFAPRILMVWIEGAPESKT